MTSLILSWSASPDSRRDESLVVRSIVEIINRDDFAIGALDARNVDGMIAKPFGSSPMNETNFQVRPPSVVRAQNGRPSQWFDLAAVRKTMAACLPSIR